MTIVNCPTCASPVAWSQENSHRPFCSKRCKLIDLGEWANESNTIAGTSIENNIDFDEFDLPLNDDFFNPNQE